MKDLNEEKLSVNILDYLDYRRYLRDIYDYRSRTKIEYSYRRFSREAGFSGPGYIKYVTENKRNLGKSGQIKMIKNLRLNERESEYFLTLVEMNTTNDINEKNSLLEKLETLRHTDNSRLLDEDLSYFLSNRMCSVIVLLAFIHRENFSPNPQWIMRKMKSDISESEIIKALKFLLDNSFIYRDSGAYKIKSINLKSSDEIKSKHIQEFHKLLLLEAISSMKLPLSDREFRNLTITINKNRIPDLKKKIKKIEEDLKLWINSGEEPEGHGNKVVVSVNFQMYPLTR